jgi:hypothetical protein
MRTSRLIVRGVAAIALLADLLGTTQFDRAGTNANPADVPNIDLALVDPDGRLIRLDPATLADAPGRHSFDLGDVSDVVRLGDGSTLATISPRGGLIVIRDGPTGAERLRIDPPNADSAPHLSDDGSRPVVERIPDGEWFGWFVYDTRDGSFVSTIAPPAGWAEAVFDRQG